MPEAAPLTSPRLAAMTKIEGAASARWQGNTASDMVRTRDDQRPSQMGGPSRTGMSAGQSPNSSTVQNPAVKDFGHTGLDLGHRRPKRRYNGTKALPDLSTWTLA